MGGKGQRRREKNYWAVHGGNDRLPPPPNAKELDTIPSKLRKLMQFKNPAPLSTQGSSLGQDQRKGGASGEKKRNKKELHASAGTAKQISHEQAGGQLATTDGNVNEVSKRKRKRKQVNDLRFQDLDKAAAHSSKKERKKEYLQARKKKLKKATTNDTKDFPRHEEIKFGEVVEAPPKLLFPKKGLKTSMDPSHERFRLEAIEAYRNQRGWMSRPGIQLPTLHEAPSS